MSSKQRRGNKLIYIVLTVIAVIVFAVYEAANGGFETPEVHEEQLDYGPFSVHFIDVGQGDCSLIKTDKGHMLIDAGENGQEGAVLGYLEKHGITELEYFVATHPHSDHIGGASEVINRVKVKNVIMPKLSSINTPTTQTYENMLTAIKKSGAKVISANPGKSYAFGDVSFTILAPFEQDENLNNMSVSLKLSYDEYSFMFTGDAERDVESRILDSGADVSADVFKLAHHGSSTSNTRKFLRAISPEYAVICCSSDNKYGHPHDETIESLEKLGINYYSTYKSGNIIFSVGENGLNVNQVKNDAE